MTRWISFVTAVLGLALVAVPVASGQGQPPGSLGPIVSPDAVDRAIAARESMQTAGRSLVFDDHRTDAAQQSTGRTLIFDNYRLDATRPEQVSATSSGREIEWPQLGIGFGVGIALLLGLMLAIRVTRTRPLAH